MDPVATLMLILAVTQKMFTAATDEAIDADDETWRNWLDDLIGHAIDLDTWLRHGGCVPYVPYVPYVPERDRQAVIPEELSLCWETDSRLDRMEATAQKDGQPAWIVYVPGNRCVPFTDKRTALSFADRALDYFAAKDIHVTWTIRPGGGSSLGSDLAEHARRAGVDVNEPVNCWEHVNLGAHRLVLSCVYPTPARCTDHHCTLEVI